MEQISFTTEDGENISLFVLEETTVSGNKYLLVCEDEEGDSEAYIMKQINEDGEDSIYEMVEDDVEFEAVAKLFEELVGEDADFDY